MAIKYFESQHDNETVHLIIRKHWFTLVPSLAVVAILYISMFFALLFIPVFWPELIAGISYNFFILAVSLTLIATTNIFFYVLLIYYLNVALVTNEHIVEIIQARLFARKVSQLELGKIQDVVAHQSGVMQTFLNFGDVDIQSAGELPNFLFKNVPKPNEYAQKIAQLNREFGVRHGTRTELGDADANVTKANQAEQEKK